MRQASSEAVRLACAALILCGAPTARATEVCHFAGTSDYNGKIGVVTTVDRAGGSITVDVAVTLSAIEFMVVPIHYLVEERSTWRGGTLAELSANTRYFVGEHIVRQQWDHFLRDAAGLRGYRVEGKRGPEFADKFPAFARYWSPDSFGTPWWQDFAAAPPVRRPDLDLTGPEASGNLRTPFATAFYWVRYLPRGGAGSTVFLPGFKTYKTMHLDIAAAPAEGLAAWHAPLHYIALSEAPVSDATAFVRPDGHLDRLAFELHGSAGSARGLIRAQGCDGSAVLPTQH